MNARIYLSLLFTRVRRRVPNALAGNGIISLSIRLFDSWMDCEKELLRFCLSASFAISSSFCSTAETWDVSVVQ